LAIRDDRDPAGREPPTGMRGHGLLAMREALELPTALWIDLGHLPGKMAQRHVAVLLDER
jgi:hypothetical protein